MADQDEISRTRADVPDRRVLRAVHQGLLGVDERGSAPTSQSPRAGGAPSLGISGQPASGTGSGRPLTARRRPGT